MSLSPQDAFCPLGINVINVFVQELQQNPGHILGGGLPCHWIQIVIANSNLHSSFCCGANASSYRAIYSWRAVPAANGLQGHHDQAGAPQYGGRRAGKSQKAVICATLLPSLSLLTPLARTNSGCQFVALCSGKGR